MKNATSTRHTLILPLVLLSGLFLLAVGCKSTPGPAGQSNPASPSSAAATPSDGQIQNDVQAKLHDEAALNGQDIQIGAENGVVTLNGTVPNDASRALAAAESGSVAGVKTVINNLTVAANQTAATPEVATQKPTPERAARPRHREAAQEDSPAPPPPSAATPSTPPAPENEAVQVVAPPPPAAPVVKTVTLPSGTVIPVRMTDGLDSATTQADSEFHGSLAANLIQDGMVAAPRGASVTGKVIEAKDAAHFKGSSELSIELTSIRTGGQQISLVTDAYTKQGAGRGKNTAVKTGGGAALGAIIGALAGGGKGAAIGAAAGGGIGAGANGITRGAQVQIPSETIVNFRLQSPISLTTSTAAHDSRRSYSDQGPALQPPQQ
jgi:hypothetical protein